MRATHSIAITSSVLAAVIAVAPGAAATDPLYSPDGVYLYDLEHASKVWDRLIDYDLPGTSTVPEVYAECQLEALETGQATSLATCLAEYVSNVRWIDSDGNAVMTQVTLIIEDPELNYRDIDVSYDEFTIYDKVDCCSNKDAEPYVVLVYQVDEDTTATKTWECQDQGAASGDCSKTWTISSPDLGPEVEQHFFTVTMWDEDVSDDDKLDISATLHEGDASFTVYKDGSAWEWHADAFAVESAGPCWQISAGTYCELQGQGDTSGDNDDAGLELTAGPTP